MWTALGMFQFSAILSSDSKFEVQPFLTMLYSVSIILIMHSLRFFGLLNISATMFLTIWIVQYSVAIFNMILSFHTIKDRIKFERHDKIVKLYIEHLTKISKYSMKLQVFADKQKDYIAIQQDYIESLKRKKK